MSLNIKDVCWKGLPQRIARIRRVYGVKRALKALYAEFTQLDYSKIEDVDVDGIDTSDYPDFCDAYISSATYKGRAMTDRELDRLNDDSDFVYSAVQDHLY
jgi:hypothetical protein